MAFAPTTFSGFPSAPTYTRSVGAPVVDYPSAPTYLNTGFGGPAAGGFAPFSAPTYTRGSFAPSLEGGFAAFSAPTYTRGAFAPSLEGGFAPFSAPTYTRGSFAPSSEAYPSRPLYNNPLLPTDLPTVSDYLPQDYRAGPIFANTGIYNRPPVAVTAYGPAPDYVPPYRGFSSDFRTPSSWNSPFYPNAPVLPRAPTYSRNSFGSAPGFGARPAVDFTNSYSGRPGAYGPAPDYVPPYRGFSSGYGPAPTYGPAPDYVPQSYGAGVATAPPPAQGAPGNVTLVPTGRTVSIIKEPVTFGGLVSDLFRELGAPQASQQAGMAITESFMDATRWMDRYDSAFRWMDRFDPVFSISGRSDMD